VGGETHTVDFETAVRRRRMVRRFTDEPVDPDLLDRLLDLSRRAPSAGNSQGVAFVVLSGPDETARYWDTTLPAARRPGFRFPGLIAAPVLVVVLTRPDSYVERYGEADKARTGLGEHEDRWTVPYWWVDAGAAVEHLLLGAVSAGLGACFFGVFDHEPAVRAALAVPPGWRTVGTVAIGHPADADEPGASVGRPRRALDEVVHRGTW
jgi:nitroreductase